MDTSRDTTVSWKSKLNTKFPNLTGNPEIENWNGFTLVPFPSAIWSDDEIEMVRSKGSMITQSKVKVNVIGVWMQRYCV